MQLAFSTNAFTRFSLIDAINAIADAGFKSIEILADVPHAYVATMSSTEQLEIEKVLQSRGMTISNINANCTFGYWKDAPSEPYFEPSLISPNPKHRQDRIDLILKTLDLASYWGAQNISITSGRCLGGMPPDKAAVQLVESLKPILDRAEQAKVNVGIELEPGLFLEYVDELRDWISKLNHARFGANLDIGHSIVIGETIEHATKTLAGRIWNMHIEDLPGRKHYHMIPGTGTFDWAELKRCLHSIQYERALTVELYTCTQDPHGAARQSYAFLSQVFNGLL